MPKLGLNYSPARFHVDSQGGSPALPALEKSREKLTRLQRGLAWEVNTARNLRDFGLKALSSPGAVS